MGPPVSTLAAARRSSRTRVVLEQHSDFDTAAALAADVRRGLTATPKVLLPKYFYDAAGCDLFDQITELPEYYQTRTELGILERIADGLVARHRPNELVELGSGFSRKTVALLDAMERAGTLDRFVPFDVAPGALLAAASRLTARYADLRVHAVAGDFDHHLGTIPAPRAGARRMVIFLGGTIGNLLPSERRPFLRTLRALLGPDDHLVVGVDLVKDVDVLERAYNDAAGVTARFNTNILAAINAALDADFDLDAFAHVAFYDPGRRWIEMRLRSLVDQRVAVRRLGLTAAFAAGEEMRTEVSCKFTREELESDLAGAGLRQVEWHTDPGGMFGVSVAAVLHPGATPAELVQRAASSPG